MKATFKVSMNSESTGNLTFVATIANDTYCSQHARTQTHTYMYFPHTQTHTYTQTQTYTNTLRAHTHPHISTSPPHPPAPTSLQPVHYLGGAPFHARVHVTKAY